MKNIKKGFTLLELLAVIIVLGIIALIAVPKVNDIINESKEKSLKVSAQNYVNAVNDKVGINKIKAKDVIVDGEYTVSELEEKDVRVDGTLPDSGSVVITNSKVYSAHLIYGSYIVDYNDNKITLTKVGDKKELELTEDSDSNGDLSLGDKVCIDTQCFYVVKVENSKVIMLSEWNLKVGRIYTDSSTYEEISPTDENYGIQDSEMIGNKSSYPFKGTIAYTERTKNVHSYDSDTLIYPYLQNYREYLNNLGLELEENDIRLLKYSEVGYINTTYTGNSGLSICANSASRLPAWVYQTSYWLFDTDGTSVYHFNSDGWYCIYTNYYDESLLGIRPVIEVDENIIKK